MTFQGSGLSIPQRSSHVSVTDTQCDTMAFRARVVGLGFRVVGGTLTPPGAFRGWNPIPP